MRKITEWELFSIDLLLKALEKFQIQNKSPMLSIQKID